MPDGTSNQTVRLSELTRRLGRRWKTFAVVVLMAVVIAAAASQFAATRYSATAALTVSPITTNPFSSGAVNQQINITTEQAILGSPEVARMAAEKLGEAVESGTLSSHTKVTAPQGSQVLEVSVSSDDPEQAARQANALADSYLEFRARGAAEVARTYIEVLDKQITALEKGATTSDRMRIAELRNQRTDLSLVSENPGRIIGYAVAPDSPSSFGLPVFLAGGLGAGIILGLLAVAYRERFARRISFADKLAEYTDQDIVTVTGIDDQESLRRVLRRLRVVQWPPRKDMTAIGVMALHPELDMIFLSGLVSAARTQNVRCALVPASAVRPEVVDSGWPWDSAADAWPEQDALFIEIGGDLAGTQIAALSERFLDSIVVVVDAHSLRSDIRKVVDTLSADADIQLLFVFVDRTRHFRRHRLANAVATGTGKRPADQQAVDGRMRIQGELTNAGVKDAP